MENLHLAETSKTPLVFFDAKAGKLILAGRSIPENSIEFYKPLYDWLEQYMKQPRAVTVFEVKLEYFNTSSSKCLVEVFRRLEEIQQKGYKVEVDWYYEEDDEDMLESGMDFKEIINLPINMKVLHNE
ncbi:MAG: DUF1987 domain-containing protein [Cytophagales bacterium]|nr:DUF1987 domain-containing protein [Cytophagales bacterium]MDW8384667.1 DUF1987 domain-containing protein [Flammeovirgaceae bacterium]